MADYPSREQINQNKLLDACVACVGEHGIRAVTMTQVIAASGLSRKTVYAYYPNKKALLDAAVNREGFALCEKIAAEIRQYDKIEDKFVYGFLYNYKEMPKNGLLRQIIDNNKDFFELVEVTAETFALFGQLCFGEIFENNPSLAEEIEEISEHWSRSLLSFILLPYARQKTDAEMEAYIRRRLVPGLHLAEYGLV